jgi:hypothetical protein
MEIEVFSRIGTTGFNYESTAIIDNFKSLMTGRYYYKTNNFSLTHPLSVEAVHLLVPDTILLINGCFYYIDNAVMADATSGEFAIEGKSLLGKVEDRIIERNYNRQARPEQIAYDHLTNELSGSKRNINYLNIKTPGNLTGGSIRYQNSYGDVLEEIESLALTYGFGIKEHATSISSPNNTVEFVKGRDLSGVVEFSKEYENLMSESYHNANYDERTTAIVLGEGEGAERKKVIVGDEFTGLERKELYVDARDLQQENDGVMMSNAEYLEVLRTRGRSKLAEHNKTFTIGGDIDLKSSLFKYGDDYDVGDRVTIKSSSLGLSKTAVLAGVEETWDEQGHHLTPIWENESMNVFEMIKRDMKK